jgi:hypothetical protein
MNKRPLVLAIALTVGAVSVLVAQQTGVRPKPATAPVFEYRVMSLMEMFGQTEAARAKIGQIMVHTGQGFQRDDMDIPDYNEALNRIAAEGWELVTVNKSNYRVFRRLNIATGG